MVVAIPCSVRYVLANRSEISYLELDINGRKVWNFILFYIPWRSKGRGVICFAISTSAMKIFGFY